MIKLSYEDDNNSVGVGNFDHDGDSDQFPTEELGYLLADLVYRIHSPRPLQILAVATDALVDMLAPHTSRLPGVDPAEDAFAVSATEVMKSWQRHDHGVANADIMDSVRSLTLD